MTDPVGDTLRTTAEGTGVGMVLGVARWAFIQNPQDLTNPAVRQAIRNVPIYAAAFGSLALLYRGGMHFAAGFRGTDDTLNYAIGGALAGAGIGFFTRSGLAATGAGLFLAATSPLAKQASEKRSLSLRTPDDYRKMYQWRARPVDVAAEVQSEEA